MDLLDDPSISIQDMSIQALRLFPCTCSLVSPIPARADKGWGSRRSQRVPGAIPSQGASGGCSFASGVRSTAQDVAASARAGVERHVQTRVRRSGCSRYELGYRSEVRLGLLRMQLQALLFSENHSLWGIAQSRIDIYQLESQAEER